MNFNDVDLIDPPKWQPFDPTKSIALFWSKRPMKTPTVRHVTQPRPYDLPARRTIGPNPYGTPWNLSAIDPRSGDISGGAFNANTMCRMPRRHRFCSVSGCSPVERRSRPQVQTWRGLPEGETGNTNDRISTRRRSSWFRICTVQV